MITNFVPSIRSRPSCHIHGRPEFHGRTYHLASPYPLLILEMAAVMQEVVEDCSPLGNPDSSWNMDGDWFAKTFRDQLAFMNVLSRRSAVRHDQYVSCRTDLPCPKLDREMMLRLARFAIDANFGHAQSCEAQAGA